MAVVWQHCTSPLTPISLSLYSLYSLPRILHPPRLRILVVKRRRSLTPDARRSTPHALVRTASPSVWLRECRLCKSPYPWMPNCYTF